MGYVSVTGGQEAIQQAAQLNHFYRVRHAADVLDVRELTAQMRLLIDRIIGEGGLYAPEYAALALKQAEGDPAEASFLLRAYRSTLPRNHYSYTIEPSGMRVIRRISSSFKDIPGGQILGPTYDYTHRLLNFSLREEKHREIREFLESFLEEEAERAKSRADEEGSAGRTVPTFQKVTDLLREQGLLAPLADPGKAQPDDVTRDQLSFPVSRSARLQMLARGETGAMTALAYSSMRGYGVVHPTIGELRVGYSDVVIPYPYRDEGDEDEEEGIYIGEILLTEVETINSFTQGEEKGEVQFQLGYGLCFGQNEVKAIAMAILERSLETKGNAPTQDEEFVLLHIDSVESNGFVSHLKLPHYITFQSALDRIRRAGERQQGEVEADEPHREEWQPSGV